ncbi:MAG: TlpA family protein disulfide reductase [Candidatus Eisenbacteria bacterium]|nr:TlpA disulfide reductase family protein [Candidatus Eisenbacteria bacterium]
MTRRAHSIPILLPLFAFLLLAACQGSGGDRKTDREAERATPAGEAGSGSGLPVVAADRRSPSPDFSLPTLAGEAFQLADRKGKVVLVDFWATWCGPCRASIPHLIDLQKQYGSQGLEVVGISLDNPGMDATVAAFARQMGINYPIVLDPSGEVANRFGGVPAIPTFFLIDRGGRTAVKVEGLRSKESLAKAVEGLLQES